MENKQQYGTCAYCGEESGRLFTPPLISPDWQTVVYEDATSVWWRCPGEGYPGKDLFDIIEVDGMNYLRPYETPNELICWECFNGHISPRMLPFVVNKPWQIKFNGWQFPEWVESLPTMHAPDKGQAAEISSPSAGFAPCG